MSSQDMWREPYTVTDRQTRVHSRGASVAALACHVTGMHFGTQRYLLGPYITINTTKSTPTVIRSHSERCSGPTWDHKLNPGLVHVKCRFSPVSSPDSSFL